MEKVCLRSSERQSQSKKPGHILNGLLPTQLKEKSSRKMIQIFTLHEKSKKSIFHDTKILRSDSIMSDVSFLIAKERYIVTRNGKRRRRSQEICLLREKLQTIRDHYFFVREILLVCFNINFRSKLILLCVRRTKRGTFFLLSIHSDNL